MLNMIDLNPDHAVVFTETEKLEFPHPLEKNRHGEVELQLREGGGLQVRITAMESPIRFVAIRWRREIAESSRVLLDAWERTYGDVGWKSMDPAKLLPWYFLLHDGETTWCYGVKVRPAAFAAWSVDPQGITLWLDLRCGTQGVVLRGRLLEIATILGAEGFGNAWETAQEFCRQMCTDPLLPPAPVYGGNNWYYAYGKSSTGEILEDCKLIAELSRGIPNRPFMVIDGGWDASGGNFGPWDSGNERFPNMPTMAAKMRETGVRPGIWFRPLRNHADAIPESWRSMRDPEYLDPSVSGVLEWVARDVRRFAEWGFELIKHDFSTYDIFGRWGFEMEAFPGQGQWAFRDRSRTSAEIILSFYHKIREAAGEMLILGCNTIGHLGAGLMHLSRIGDDTSGRNWERTRKMGVNTLAFRLPQHRAFFDIDADCLGVTGAFPWELNCQWARLLAGSGTPLFVSLKPGVLDEGGKQELRKFFQQAAQQKSRAIPLDWFQTVCPESWELDGEVVHFNWYTPECYDADFLR